MIFYTQHDKTPLTPLNHTTSFFRIWLIPLCLMLLFAQCAEKDTDPAGEAEEGAVEITPEKGMDLYGFIGDENGNPVKEVVVSDGFYCTVTDEKGIYQMKKSAAATFVYYSTPSEYEINTVSTSVKVASFYTKINPLKKRYDFTLKKLPAAETSFSLICIGDPQVTSDAEVHRFQTETMSDIKAFTQTIPSCYGLIMGDLTGNKPALTGQMKTLIGSANMTAFVTIGNHDKVATTIQTKPSTSDAFEAVFGPTDYSFNRGDVHFVCLDDIIFSDASTYSGGFTDNQVAWLLSDLSYVNKSKMVVVYYHIPLRGTSSIANRTRVLNALNGFAEVHLMCGHTHYNENYIQTSPLTAYEHIHGAACGAWWRSTLNGDGAPNGYAVYNVKGNTLTNWYYKPTELSKDFQIRLHKGNESFGGSYGYFSFDQGNQTVVANVWNSDSKWKVEAYENGIKVADLTPLPPSSKDAWTMGYHIGVLNRDPDNYDQPCKHLYLHTMLNPAATLEIRATDRFGNQYRQSEIISNFTTASSY